MDTTETLNQGAEEVNEDRLNELAENKERTEEENKEFNDLRVQKDKQSTKARIDDLTWQAKSAQEKLAERDAEIERLRSESEKKVEPAPQPLRKEFISVGDKSFFTDDTLQRMVDSKEISLQQANAHRDERVEEVAADKAYRRLKGETEEQQKRSQLEQETREVFEKYPTWDSKDRGHNPNDPVYKTANELYQNGLSIKKAMQTAEKLHGVNKPRPDNSDNFSVNSPSAPNEAKEIKEQPLTDDEKELAVRTWRNVVNPKTGRVYTEKESILKHEEARRNRPRRT